MRASAGIYIAAIAAAFGLATLITRIASPNDQFLASILDAAFVASGVGALELWAYRRRVAAHAASRRGTATFVFTDVESSTALLKQVRDRYPELLGEVEDLMRRSLVSNGGEVVDTQGDSLFVVFATAGEAVRGALSAQEALAAKAWPEGSGVRVRMGIHTGDAAATRNRYFGLGVHRAARICALARGGEILCSQTTRDLVLDEEQSGESVGFEDTGEHELKDLSRPVRLYRVLPAGAR